MNRLVVRCIAMSIWFGLIIQPISASVQQDKQVGRIETEWRLVKKGLDATIQGLKGKTLTQDERASRVSLAKRIGVLIGLIAIVSGGVYLAHLAKKRPLLAAEKSLPKARTPEQQALNKELWDAVVNNDQAAVQEYIRKGADPNQKDAWRRSLFSNAIADKKDNEVVKLLMTNATVNAQDAVTGETPLHEAARIGNREIVQALLDKGAKADIKSKQRGERPFEVATDKEIIKLLEEKALSLQDLKDKRLLEAVERNDLAEVKKYLGQGADPNQILHESSNPESLISRAIEGGNEGIAELLIAEAKKDVINMGGMYNFTPLHGAAMHSSVKIVQALLDKGADVNARDLSGDTPLHTAAARGDTEIVKALLDAGAKANIKNWREFPHDVAKGSEVKQLLVNVFYAQEQRDKGLLEAVESNNLDAVKKSLEQGADPIQKDVSGKPLLYYAIQNNKAVAVVKELIAKARNVNMDDRHGVTLLHIAAMHSSVDIVQTLLAKGADVNAKNVDDKTPLHAAAARGNTEIVQALLAAGARKDLKNLYNQTSYDVAKEWKRTAILDLLKP